MIGFADFLKITPCLTDLDLDGAMRRLGAAIRALQAIVREAIYP
jgi:hypothetical protein